MATGANRDRGEPVQFEARGWAGLRRARLVVTPTQVVIITRDGRNEIGRDALRRAHCSSNWYDRIALSTDDRELVFRVSDITPFALWARRNALAPRVELDSDVGQAVKEAEADERDEQELRTGLDAQGRIKTANIAQRFFARIVDLIVIFVLALAIMIASGSSDGAFIGFIFALMPVYEIPLVAFFGCTIGKLWPSGIRVVRVETGRPPALLPRERPDAARVASAARRPPPLVRPGTRSRLVRHLARPRGGDGRATRGRDRRTPLAFIR